MEANMDIDIGKRILNLRKSLNLPRYVFADKIMYNVKTVYRWEHNETEPSLTDLLCICKTLILILNISSIVKLKQPPIL